MAPAALLRLHQPQGISFTSLLLLKKKNKILQWFPFQVGWQFSRHSQAKILHSEQHFYFNPCIWNKLKFLNFFPLHITEKVKKKIVFSLFLLRKNCKHVEANEEHCVTREMDSELNNFILCSSCTVIPEQLLLREPKSSLFYLELINASFLSDLNCESSPRNSPLSWSHLLVFFAFTQPIAHSLLTC